MSSHSQSINVASGKNNQIVQFRTDRRVGRVDFKFRGISGTSVKIVAEEEDLAGNKTTISLAAVELKPLGDATLSVVSQKPILRLKTASDNTGEAQFRIDATFIGLPLNGGQLDISEGLPRSGYSGDNISGSGIL